MGMKRLSGGMRSGNSPLAAYAAVLTAPMQAKAYRDAAQIKADATLQSTQLREQGAWGRAQQGDQFRLQMKTMELMQKASIANQNLNFKYDWLNQLEQQFGKKYALDAEKFIELTRQYEEGKQFKVWSKEADISLRQSAQALTERGQNIQLSLGQTGHALQGARLELDIAKAPSEIAERESQALWNQTRIQGQSADLQSRIQNRQSSTAVNLMRLQGYPIELGLKQRSAEQRDRMLSNAMRSLGITQKLGAQKTALSSLAAQDRTLLTNSVGLAKELMKNPQYFEQFREKLAREQGVKARDIPDEAVLEYFIKQAILYQQPGVRNIFGGGEKGGWLDEVDELLSPLYDEED